MTSTRAMGTGLSGVMCILRLIQTSEISPSAASVTRETSHTMRASAGPDDMLAIMNAVPTMPTMGTMGPPGTLNARGALGKRRLSASTSTSARM